MRVALMHNPSSGEGTHDAEVLRRAISSAGHEVLYRSTDEEDWQRPLDDPVDLVAVAGGDGTVRKVFKLLADTGIPVTVLPLGSANNIARTLGFEGDDVARFARGWDRGRRRPYTLGLLSSDSLSERFVETVGGGIFAELLARAEEHVEEPGGEDNIEHGLRMLRETVTAAPAFRWDITVDGDDLSGELLAVEVMNVSETGPNVPLSPRAEPGDGDLDLVLVPPEQREELVSYLEARLADRLVEPPRFLQRGGSNIALRAPEGCPLRLDDELISGRTDVGPIRGATVTLDGSVEILVPATT